jgi:hypothetical protein
MLLPRHFHVSARTSSKLPSPGLHLTIRGLLLALLLLLGAGSAVFGARRSGGSALDLILAVGPDNAPKPEPKTPSPATSGRGLLQSQQEQVAAMAAAAASVCALPPRVIGVCRGAVPRYSYDPATGRCEPYTWGGCGEDVDNRFDELRKCQEACERGPATATGGGKGIVSSWPSPSPSSSSSADKSINVTTLPSQAVPPPRVLVDETEQADDKDAAAAGAAASSAGDGGGRLAAAALAVVAAAALMV